MKTQNLVVMSLLGSLALLSGCDGGSAGRGSEAADTPNPHEKNRDEAVGTRLEALEVSVKQGAPFDEALAAVEEEMGKSPLQQGEFWNFGEYDSSGACLHLVLVRSGDKVQQVQFTKYEPGSSGFGWCAEMKIERS